MSAVGHPREGVGDNRVVDAARGTVTAWRDLSTVELSGPTVAAVRRSADAAAYVAAHTRSGEELLVVAADRLTADLRQECLDLGLAVETTGDGEPTREGPPQPRPSEPGRIWLLTSGSTGRPKRVAHTLDSLATVGGAQPPRRWLCPYSPGTYAWWQVMTLVATAPGQDVVVVDPHDLDAWPEAALEHGVTAASGTPTFWRQSIMRSADTLRRLPLEQVTLGGEPVDQAILDQVREVFPAARVSWIYASSEAGASIVVHDGVAGFPLEWVGRRTPGRVAIEIEGEELVLTSPHGAEGLTGPLRTGDRVEVADGRVRIVGRIDRDEINVGGTKISAGVVRETLLAHPDVRWAAVRGRTAPMVGSVVVAEVVLHDTADETTAGQALRDWCADRLPDAAVPRRIAVRPEIPLKETLKSDV